MTSRILLRRGTAAQWASANPILGSGELGVETDTLKFKIGNGTSTWTQLTSYANITPSDLTSAINGLINAAPSALDTLNELAAAINNDSSFSTTVNNLLNGKVSKSGGDTITASTASTVGLIIKAATSQTADIQRWQDSGGNTIAKIGPLYGSNVFQFDPFSYGAGSGYSQIVIGGRSIVNEQRAAQSKFGVTTGEWSLGSLRATDNQVGAFAVSTTLPTLVVKSSASQTANLQEWQNSAGTVLAKVDSNGSITAGTNLIVGNASMFYTGGNYYNSTVNILTQGAGYSGIVIRGQASQTANLQEWQNNSGGVLLSISADGTLNKTGTLNIGPILQFADPGVGNETKFNFQKTSDSAYLTVKERSSDQTYYEFGMWDNALDGGDYFQWHMGQWSGGTGYNWMPLQLGYNASPNGSKSQTLRFTGEQSVFWSPILTGSNTPYYTTNPNYQTHQDFDVTKGWAATANSTNIPRTNASGGATLNIDLSGYTYSARMGYRLTVDAGGTTFSYTTYGGDNSSGSAIAITGGWQTLSNGTKIKINGTAAANDDWQFLAFPTPRVAFGGTTDTTSLVTIKPSASDKGLVIRAAASPTVSIQEWQDSSGAAKINFNNSFNATFNNGVGVYGNYGNVAALVVGTTATTLPAIVAQAALNQTADIQQWQNNSGTVLTRISSSGRLGINIGSNPSSMIHVVTDGTASTGLILRGQSGQTGNLQEWHDGSGNALALVNSSGAIITGGIVRATNGGIFGGTAQLSTALTVYAQTPGQIGQIIRAAASQTASLQEWQNNNGDVLAYVESGGHFGVGNLYSSFGGSATKLGYVTISGSLPAIKPLVIRGATSQTANLQEWQDSSGNTLGTMSPYGTFTAQNRMYAGWAAFGSGFGTGASASNVILIAKGAASQTANLQEWQDSNGSIMSKVSSSGDIYAVSRSVLSRFVQADNGAGAYIDLGFSNANSVSIVGRTSTTAPQLIIKGINSQTADLQQWQRNDGLVLGKIDINGQLTVIDFTAGAVNATWRVYSVAGDPSVVPIIAKGRFAQSADLQQWQDSTGSIVAKIGPTGATLLSASNYQYAYPTVTIGDAAYGFSAEGAALRYYTSGGSNGSHIWYGSSDNSVTRMVLSNNGTLGLKGISGQTANLQEWQNSAGTVQASVNNVGIFNSNNATGYQIASATFYGSLNGGQTALIQAGPSVGTNPHLVVRQSVTQTGNLQEWQAYDGTIAAKVLPGGYMQSPIFFSTMFDAPGSTGTYLSLDASGGSSFNIRNAAHKGLIIKGAASQTANLQEWQNSSGTALAFIESSGKLRSDELQGITNRIGIYQPTILPPSSTNVALIVKGQSSQTANLQEWQNSSGTALGSFNAYGSLYVSNIVQSGTAQFGNTGYASASQVVLAVKGFASQTADLQQWQDSTGATYLSIGATYVDGTGTYTPIKFSSGGGGEIKWGSNTVWAVGKVIGQTNVMYPYSSDRVALIIKGLSSQSADLQQWQNSAGTVLAKIDASGIGTFAQGSFAGGAAIIDGGGGATLSAIYTGALKNSATAYNFFSNVTGSPYATVVVKSLSGQTTNLQEWQNNSGTVLAKITSTGAFDATAVTVNGAPLTSGSGLSDMFMLMGA